MKTVELPCPLNLERSWIACEVYCSVVDVQKTTWNFFSRLLITGLGVLFVGLILVAMFGSVSGEQISPQTFEMRSYRYYRIPWTRIQIMPVKYTKITNELVSYLADEKLLVQGASNKKWDEVVFGTSEKQMRGRAWVLASTLQTLDYDRVNHWLQWSENHPEAAKVLWKHVSCAAVDGVYFVIPELTERAKSLQKDPERAAVALAQIMHEAYSQQIAALVGDENTEEVDRLPVLRHRLAALSEPSSG